MATGNDKVKRKRSLEVKETKSWKKVKFICSSSQSSDTTTSAGIMQKCNSNDFKKEKSDSPKSKPISKAAQSDDKTLSDKLMGSEKELGGQVIKYCTVLASQTEVDSRVSDQSTSTSEQSKSLFYITPEDDRHSLKEHAADLKREIKRMNRELRKYADMCMKLNDENELIMDELKQVFPPCVIQMIEAKNPYNNPQTDQETELPKKVP